MIFCILFLCVFVKGIYTNVENYMNFDMALYGQNLNEFGLVNPNQTKYWTSDDVYYIGNSDFKIKCVSNDMINLDIKFLWMDGKRKSEIKLETNQYLNMQDTSTYEYGKQIISIEDYNWDFILQADCYQIQNSSVSKRIYAFLNVRPWDEYLHINQKIVNIHSGGLIPCISTDPKQNISLSILNGVSQRSGHLLSFLKIDHIESGAGTTSKWGSPIELTEEENDPNFDMSDVSYSPILGFSNIKNFNGDFQCESSDNSDRVFWDTNFLPGVSPYERNSTEFKSTRELFLDKEINFVCKSMTKNEEANLEFSGLLPHDVISYIKNETHFKSISVTFRNTSTRIVQIMCITKSQYHEWTFKIIDKPVLFVNQNNGPESLNCGYKFNFGPKDPNTEIIGYFVDTFECKDVFDCQSKLCYGNQDIGCLSLTQDSRTKDLKGSNCEKSVNMPYDFCANAETTLSRGYINCMQGGNPQPYMFHNSIADQVKKLIVGEPVHIEDLMMIKSEPLYYINQEGNLGNKEIRCMGLRFLLFDKLRLELKYRNGSTRFIDDMFYLQYGGNYGPIKSNPILNVQANFNKFSVDVEEIICYAHLKNSSKWISTSKSIDIRYATSPLIISSETEKNVTFKINSRGNFLNCRVEGHPRPESVISWIQNNMTELKDFSKKYENAYELKLEFPIITRDLAGIYQCIAKNDFSSHKADFIVHTIDERKPVIISNEHYRNITFYTNSTGKKLSCKVNTEVETHIEWIYKNKKISKVSKSRFKITNRSNFEQILEFLELTEEMTGTYTCKATNIFNTDFFDTADFMVNVTKPEKNSSESQNKVPLIVGISIPLIFIFMLVILIIFLWRNNRMLKNRELTEEEIEEFFKGKKDSRNKYEISVENPFDVDKFEIPFENIFIDYDDILGSGQFGLVLRGKLNLQDIAIKTTKEKADINFFKALLSELKIMSQIGDHPNIVGFLGASTTNIKQRKIYVLIEICPLGNLHSFLRKNARDFENLFVNDKSRKIYENTDEIQLNSYDMALWSSQIANGMKYLGSKKVIHGDLAARNVLLFSRNHIKITDFGLSRQLNNDYSIYIKKQRQPLPWAWLALESLKFLTFSTQSDVWAYGVTIWEIFSLAETPFAGYSFNLEFKNLIENGLRLCIPSVGNNKIYDELKKCWENDPRDRPNFEHIEEFFIQIARKLKSDNELYTECNE